MNLKDLTRGFLAQRQQLMAYVNGLVRDANLADDIVQDIWLRLADAHEAGQTILDVQAWSRGVARNMILEHWRKQRTAKVVADERIIALAEQAFQENTPDALWSARRAALGQCVEALPERSRRMLALKYLQGKKASAIATILQQTEMAIMKALSRLRQSLANCVHDRLIAERARA